VLHKEGEWENTSRINEDISITTSKDILLSMASGNGPSESLLILGYSGWGAGQLEQELKTNSWINAPASQDILFTVPYKNRWEEAINLLGVNVSNISGQIGHA
jgi:putative transcriptional regulator